jgi:cell division protein FtsB
MEIHTQEEFVRLTDTNNKLMKEIKVLKKEIKSLKKKNDELFEEACFLRAQLVETEDI